MSEEPSMLIKISEKKQKLGTLRLKKRNSTNHTTSIYKKNQQLEEASTAELSTDEKRMSLLKTTSLPIKKKSYEDSLDSA